MQKPPSCPCCGHGFGCKEAGQVNPHGSRLPILLQCGHTVCESCLTKLCPAESKTLNCPLCQKGIDLKENGVKSLPIDTYTLGLSTLSKRLTIDRLRSHSAFQQPDSNTSSSAGRKKEQIKPRRQVCVECNTKTATCRCDKCETTLCATCFDKVHKASRTLRLHHDIPLQVDITGGVPAVCTKHDNRPIDYFCEDDHTPICSHCVIMGDHKGHGITGMEDINKKALVSLEPAIEQAKIVLQRMKRSDKLLCSTVPHMKSAVQAIVEEISSAFRHAHAMLQIRETALLEDLNKIYTVHGTPLEQLRSKLQGDLWDLDELVKEAHLLVNDSRNKSHINARGILNTLQQCKSLPCFAMKVNNDDNPGLVCNFSDDFVKSISSFGKLEGDINVSVTILSLDEVPPELLDAEDLDSGPISGTASVVSDGPSLPTDRSVGTGEIEPDSDSISDLSDMTGSSKSASTRSSRKPPRKSRLVTTELVYVTHIKNPHHFMVQKCSEFTRITQLQRLIKKHCSSEETAKDIPNDIAIGDYVLSKFKGTWYRARIITVISVLEITDPSCIQLEVYYIDFGNTEIVLLYNLRGMQSKFMKIPELAKPCSLYGIVPISEDKGWSSESIKDFARMIGDKPMQMNVKCEQDDMLYIDLCRPGCIDIEEDPAVSVRDSLVFLEHARLTHAGGSSTRSQKRYFAPSLPCRGAKIPCMVSHVTSPHKFFVQLINDEVQYMVEMMSQLQHAYTQDQDKDLYSVFCPYQDMVCASHFEADQMWYRAQVLDLPAQGLAKVKYVDYGNEEYVSNWKLQKLMDRFMVLPVQAICCTLSDVELLSNVEDWTEETVHNFAMEVTTKKMEILVKSVGVDGVLEVVLSELLDPSQDSLLEAICYNRWLVENTMALSTGPSSMPLLKVSTTKAEIGHYSLPVLANRYQTSGYARQQASERAMALARPPIVPGTPLPQATDGPVELNTEKPNTLEVSVSRIVSPGHMYLNLVSKNEEREKFMEVLNAYFTRYPQESVSVLTPGSACAVVYAEGDGKWYRGKILSVIDNIAEILLVDYGYETSCSVSALKKLPVGILTSTGEFTFQCHLLDLQPAGDPNRWSRTSVEFITELLKDEICYIKTEDNSYLDKTSVGVDLLKEEIIKGDALTADTVTYSSVRKILLEKGLALPKRANRKPLPKDQKQDVVGEDSTKKDSKTSPTKTDSLIDSNISNLEDKSSPKSKSGSLASSPTLSNVMPEESKKRKSTVEALFGGKASSPPISVKDTGSPTDLATEQSDVVIDPSSSESDETVQHVIDPSSSESDEIVQHGSPLNRSLSTLELPSPEDTTAPVPEEIENDYKYAEPLAVGSRIDVVPTYIDYDCHIFVHTIKPDDDPEGRLGFVLKENTIEVKLQNAYFEKMGLFRANIIRDGNCLFRACAASILNDQERHDEIRRTVVDTLHDYWYYFTNYNEGLNKDTYLLDMSLDGKYGGEPEIQAICLAYGIQVQLYMGGLSYAIRCRNYGRSIGTVLKLSYVSDGEFDYGHYDLIVGTTTEAAAVNDAYNKWRKMKVEDYEMHNRASDNNLYENSILSQMMTYLAKKYTTSLPTVGASYSPGQSCVAQYSDDMAFYRAKILDISTLGYKVKFVDFGNDECVPDSRLRPDVIFPEIPIQCYECVMNNFLPPPEHNGWTVPVLDKIHEHLVSQTFTMTVEDTYGSILLVNFDDVDYSNKAYKFFELGLGTLDFANFEVETTFRSQSSTPTPSVKSQTDNKYSESHAVAAPESLSSGITEAFDDAENDFIAQYGIPQRQVKSPYSSRMQMSVDDCFPCSITQVDAPDIVYIQRVKQSNADETEMVAVNNQLDQLLLLLETLNREYTQYKNISKAEPGMACCAQYSLDSTWYRAEILSTGHGPDGDMCGILFVDYGSSEYIPEKSLLALPPMLMKLPVQSTRCHLSGVCPPSGADTWDPDAVLLMTQVLAAQILIAHVTAMTDKVEINLFPQEEFFAIGLESPLVYDDLIRSGVIGHSITTEEESEVIIDEIYEENMERSAVEKTSEHNTDNDKGEAVN